MSGQRLTDEQLTKMDRDPRALTYIEWWPLLNEVRRLRSDEWLLAAAEEIVARRFHAATGEPGNAYEALIRADMLAILRKHRDGGA